MKKCEHRRWIATYIRDGDSFLSSEPYPTSNGGKWEVALRLQANKKVERDDSYLALVCVVPIGHGHAGSSSVSSSIIVGVVAGHSIRLF